MFKAFECARGSDDESSISDIVAAAKAKMLECNKRMAETNCCDHLKEYLERTSEVHSKMQKEFTSEKDPNWKFWTNFVFRDMLSYLSLFVYA